MKSESQRMEAAMALAKQFGNAAVGYDQGEAIVAAAFIVAHSYRTAELSDKEVQTELETFKAVVMNFVKTIKDGGG